MSTLLSKKQNQCYSIQASHFDGGEKEGTMIHMEIYDGESYTCIALLKKDTIDFCLDIIKGLNDVDARYM